MNLSEHSQEGALDIASFERRCLHEEEILALGKFRCVVGGHCRKTSEIRLVPNEHYDNVSVGMPA